MSAADTIENLIRVGVLIKDAARKTAGVGSIDWTAFLASSEYRQMKASVMGLLSKLKESELDDAIKTIEEKQTRKNRLICGSLTSLMLLRTLSRSCCTVLVNQ